MSWRDLTTAAVVGTGRRAVPDWPPGLTRRGDVAPEQRLLDAAAVGGALRRAGRTTGTRDEPLDAAPADRRPAASERAARLLDLVLVQPPVGRRLQPALLRVWADEAERRGVRVPHAGLVPLLTAATADRALRDAVVPVLDARGRWLAAQRPEWAWAVADDSAGAEPVADVDPLAWAQRPTAQRVVSLAALRAHDPARGRELLATTWGSDPAAARAELLATLVTGLSDADEPVLEAALDDRGAAVRQTARDLLDRLPASGRARRLGALLRPLVGAVDGRVVVELPTVPDRAAVRDGLVPGPRGRSERAFWLGVLTRGAPLEVWTEATGLDPTRVVATLDEPAASLELRVATRLRGDLSWARAHVAHGWEPTLLGLLPADERREVVVDRVARSATLAELVDVVRLLDGPWSPEVSHQVLTRLVALPDGSADTEALTLALATRLHPDARSQLEPLAARDTPLHDPLHRAAHFLSLVPTIQEAFA